MVAYHRAILGNASCFKGKTVLDVGTGTGILALWCAKAGAAKVYCVEYTGIAKLAKNLIAANGTTTTTTTTTSTTASPLSLCCAEFVILTLVFCSLTHNIFLRFR